MLVMLLGLLACGATQTVPEVEDAVTAPPATSTPPPSCVDEATGAPVPCGTASSGSPATSTPADITVRDPKGVIQSNLSHQAHQVKACYESRLAEARLHDQPFPTGRMAVEIDISAGLVTRVLVAEDEPGDPKLTRCVEHAIKRWTFPSWVTEEQIYLPFVFSPN